MEKWEYHGDIWVCFFLGMHNFPEKNGWFFLLKVPKNSKTRPSYGAAIARVMAITVKGLRPLAPHGMSRYHVFCSQTLAVPV
jgi:hypothetical protein